MTETQRADQQAGDNLVAQAQKQRAFEHSMTEADSRPHGDIVAAEQRQFHRQLALRHPVAHRRNAACDLRGRAFLACPQLNLFGITAIGLMRRQHVIIGGDDTDIHRLAATDCGFVITARRETMRQISARQHITINPGISGAGNQIKIGGAARFRAFNDTISDGFNNRMELIHASSLHRARPMQLLHWGPIRLRRNFWA